VEISDGVINNCSDELCVKVVNKSNIQSSLQSLIHVETLKRCILPTECICVLRTVVAINSDYFPEQQRPVGLRIGDVIYFL
jgi:hypothetical protein